MCCVGYLSGKRRQKTGFWCLDFSLIRVRFSTRTRRTCAMIKTFRVVGIGIGLGNANRTKYRTRCGDGLMVNFKSDMTRWIWTSVLLASNIERLLCSVVDGEYLNKYRVEEKSMGYPFIHRWFVLPYGMFRVVVRMVLIVGCAGVIILRVFTSRIE